jgi:hypothetical protein
MCADVEAVDEENAVPLICRPSLAGKGPASARNSQNDKVISSFWIILNWALSPQS